MLTKIQLKTMLDLQNDMNCTVDRDWVELDRNWMLAASLEAAEAIGHHGWKWWKKQSPDMEQLKVELIDIWHFVLSDYIVKINIGNEGISSWMHNLIGKYQIDNDIYADSTLLSDLQSLMSHCAANNFSMILFMAICEKAGLTHDMLYKTYIGKNVLNIFRQNNGYKDGSYVKIWGGEEDNVHLVRIIETLDTNDERFAIHLMSKLQLAYTQYT